jgi:hypothetical protein
MRNYQRWKSVQEDIFRTLSNRSDDEMKSEPMREKKSG